MHKLDAAVGTDGEQVTAVFTGDFFHLGAELLCHIVRNKHLDGTAEAAAVDTAGATTAQKMLGSHQRNAGRLGERGKAGVDVLQKDKGRATRQGEQLEKALHVLFLERLGNFLRTQIFGEEVVGTNYGTVTGVLAKPVKSGSWRRYSLPK